jgi:hypothetical protein
LTNAKGEQLERMINAVMKMKKLDVAALRQAYAG